MPKYSPQYYEEKMAESNRLYINTLDELREYREDSAILCDSRDKIYEAIAILKVNQYQASCISDNLNSISNLVAEGNNKVPGFEKLLCMDDLLGYNKTFDNTNDDYCTDLISLVDEIEECLDTYAEKMFDLKLKVYAYANSVNDWRYQYCMDYGMAYSPVYTEIDYNKL